MESIALKAYNSRQPRYPKGHPHGGQWKGTGSKVLDLDAYREFSGKGSAKQIEDFVSAWTKGKTIEQLIGENGAIWVNAYTNGLSSYINANLRGIKPPHQLRGYTKEDGINGIGGMDRAIAKFPALPKPVQVWKGLDPRNFPGGLANASLIGKTFTDLAFGSTSFYKGNAQIFVKGAIARILLPKGTRGVYASLASVFKREMSEYEFIIARGARYFIENVEETSWVPTVTLRLLLGD